MKRVKREPFPTTINDSFELKLVDRLVNHIETTREGRGAGSFAGQLRAVHVATQSGVYVVVLSDEDGRLWSGFSKCNLSDKFSRYNGIKFAVLRALDQCRKYNSRIALPDSKAA